MHTLSRRALMFAACLSAMAGYVDAIGFLQLGGYFVSFMSGNSTRLAVAAAQGEETQALLLAAIIGLFMSGAMLGTLAHRCAGRRNRATAVLCIVTLLLGGASVCDMAGLPTAGVLLLAVAMGAANATLQRGDTLLGVTYMSGALVKIGQLLAEALLGGRKGAWLPYLLPWGGLVTGGISGALLFQRFGLHSIWLAVLWATLLTAASAFLRVASVDPADRITA